MVWTISSIIYNIVMQLFVLRGKLTSEFSMAMWMVVFVIGAIEFSAYYKSKK